MKWRNAVLLSFSSSSAKQKRQDFANNNTKPRLNSNGMRLGTFFSSQSQIDYEDKELQGCSYILPVLHVLPFPLGVRQTRTVFARRRRRRGESLLSRNTCKESNKH